jgi:hypothetical protein
MADRRRPRGRLTRRRAASAESSLPSSTDELDALRRIGRQWAASPSVRSATMNSTGVLSSIDNTTSTAWYGPRTARTTESIKSVANNNATKT